MRLASFLVLMSTLLSGCGIRGPLYLPENKPAQSKSVPTGEVVPQALPAPEQIKQ
ncbi:LPS translocon maturation chaperone LptM [Sulfurirhabdus autotrophica]|uniref:Putative lipoprotein n=1 Tax=Sulfurirhabdus autotrophica TaxID=1706046 RepID=A0A4R3Y793_9PROT|nr:lipoprotein [Sulfurirhabdus autotrophica]TCV86394.1 putative lipoprotein [Sulfurirhabdus autotrophica]